ncbi:MAG: hypothetical protein A3E25_21700 [Burkholderiales bacterium RIFCSPHIGHO2_12_FULL_69_20]|jgi:hypothetical protein|nr:MAG: hypothetical protein A3E25_21700 [Burkholderiales bacterium RIFCSPHIGHO2_12_FULL_69_20]
MNDTDTHSTAAAPADVAELMVCTMSDWLLRAEVIQLGLASALNQVAALLAQARTNGQGPALEDPAALTLTRAQRPAFLSRSERAAQIGALRRYEAPEWIGQMMPRLAGRVRQFVRPLQIDAQGRINSLRMADKQGRLRRFAGLAGLAELAEIAQPFLVYLPQQDQRCFVDTVDFVVADPLAAHPPGVGHVVMVTDLAVFEFTTVGARALSRHPGVTHELLRERTPAAVAVGGVPVTPGPDAALLHTLRTQIDPHRVRDIEFATGAARREALLRLHAREAAHALA